MKAFIVISIIFVVLIWLYIARNWNEGAKFYVPKVHKELLETFAVLGGLNDVRYGRLGSTVHSTGTLGKWIKVASFTNVNPMQNHALTLEVFPQNKGLGTSKQSFSFLVRNSTTDQDGDPVFIQQNQYDGTNWTRATFTTASVVRSQDAKNKLSNTYDFYLQLGTENAYGIPVIWYLNDFLDADVIAVGDVDQINALPTSTSVYKPRLINQDEAGNTGTVFTNRICNPAGDRCFNLSDADNLTAAAKADATPAKLYSFSTFTFKTCGAAGRIGPTLSQCLTAYSSTPWASSDCSPQR